MSILRIESEENIFTAPVLKDRLVQALASGQTIVLDDANARELDLSCLQTLVAAHRAAAARGIELHIGQPCGEVLAKALTRAGIDPAFLNPKG